MKKYIRTILEMTRDETSYKNVQKIAIEKMQMIRHLKIHEELFTEIY